MTGYMRLLIPLAAILLAAASADAGIVVLKNGKVILGKIDEAKSDKVELVMYPPRAQEGRGEFKVERSRIRWYSGDHDSPSDEYWKQHGDEKIDKDWEPERQRWLLRQKNKLDVVPVPMLDKELLGTRRVTFSSGDGLSLSGDLYGGDAKARTVILLCHQASSSRGEYKAIAPRLVKAGYTCLALDQRSGRLMNGIPNESAERAKKAGKPQSHGDARQDIEAAIGYLRKRGHSGKLVLWGSSYSAALALMIGAESKEVSAVIAFSPGEFVKPKGSVGKQSKALACPLLVVGPEKERTQMTALYEGVASSVKKLLVDKSIHHGSKTLYTSSKNKIAWAAVLEFLQTNCRSSK
jgi:dienelactone hydrolase